MRKDLKNQSSTFGEKNVCLSKFGRELRKLKCSVTYHEAGRGRKGGKKGWELVSVNQ